MQHKYKQSYICSIIKGIQDKFTLNHIGKMPVMATVAIFALATLANATQIATILNVQHHER